MSGDGNPRANAPGRLYTLKPPGVVLGFVAPAVPGAVVASEVIAAEAIATAAVADAAVAAGAVAVGGEVAVGGGVAAGGAVAAGTIGTGGLLLIAIGVGAVGYLVYDWATAGPKPKPALKPVPAAQPKVATENVRVRTEEEDKKPKRCPVCDKGIDPAPGVPAPYLTPPRPPKDWETIPPLMAYKRTSMVVQGARVWETPDKQFIHVDNLHAGKGAELEVYDSKGKHLYAICPRCGTPKAGSNVPGRRLPKH
jgi:hypothetical protein